MNNLKIKQNHHYPTLPSWPLFFKVAKIFTISHTYQFTDSCLYHFGDVDDFDKNKLFGISLSLLPRIRTKQWAYGRDAKVMFFIGKYVVINPIHWNSVRVGWCCDFVNKEIKLTPYMYKDGERVYCEDDNYFDIDTEVVTSLSFAKNAHNVIIKIGDKYSYIYYYKIKWYQILLYKSGLYFGGNKAAPHDILIKEIK